MTFYKTGTCFWLFASLLIATPVPLQAQSTFYSVNLITADYLPFEQVTDSTQATIPLGDTDLSIDTDEIALVPHTTAGINLVAEGLGVFPLDITQTPIDCLAADGHKWLRENAQQSPRVAQSD